MCRVQNADWKHLLTVGNECYNNHDWANAEYHYDLAFSQLLEQCHKEPNNCELLMAWICSCHNLSTLFESQEKLPAAMRYLLLPHQHCKHILAEHSSTEQAKALAIQAISVTYPPIVEFSNNYPHLAKNNVLVSAAVVTDPDNVFH